ncbi:DEAD/DEAH box helicase [Rheinheimera marina]|uniref:DEAD/DEAH box helicase n=1 Tax=Rheinheimera marina TaxID=1774958 RepID=A0ABV9JKF2_9GAMM
MSFQALGLQPALVEAVAAAGYTQPTPIQQQAIPAVLSKRDLLAAAQTGTGKTASFVLPILEMLSGQPVLRPRPTRALILTPTRELAAQIEQQIQKYGQLLQPKLRHHVVFGGVSINPQMMALRGGVDILTATPGRLLDLVSKNALKLDQVQMLVLDEADRMLDMGFIHDIKKILAMLPKQRQNLLFSATFSNEIKDLTQGLLHNPLTIQITPENTTVERIDQQVYMVPKGQKTAALCELIEKNRWQQVLVFMPTKHQANRLTEQLVCAGISAAALHGNKSQNARTKALEDFKEDRLQVLVATDVAARGIDIAQLPYVVNYELPRSSADYVHRIGRTGRAGKSGLAVSLISADEQSQLKQVEKLIGLKLPVKDFKPAPLSAELQAIASAPRPPRPVRRKPEQGGKADGQNSGQGKGRAGTGRPSQGHSQGQGGQGKKPEMSAVGKAALAAANGQPQKPAQRRFRPKKPKTSA